ncbi:hypothetical protein [Chryseobacterium balustinum]|uniref:hypothetical protein n=1 Tax=Chryseobacterium balustinum TaxID=246 RepID=UPI003CFA46F7
MKKLELKNLKVKKITSQEQKSVKGGLLSIGYECSARNNCDRMHSRTWGVCIPNGNDDPRHDHDLDNSVG